MARRRAGEGGVGSDAGALGLPGTVGRADARHLPWRMLPGGARPIAGLGGSSSVAGIT